MPRLDPDFTDDMKLLDEATNADVIFQALYEDGQQIDVCRSCCDVYGFEAAVQHPPYEDDDYICAVCGEDLTSEDN